MPSPISPITGSSGQTMSANVLAGSGSDLTMQDFFTLIAAQLQNQNMLEPVDNTEFLSQMAQFSTLSAMQELSTGFTDFLSVSYIGKNVTATQIASGGSTQTIKGTVEKVEYLSGETYLTVNGTRISPNEITEISA